MHMSFLFKLTFALMALGALSSCVGASTKNPVEVGTVQWGRDLDQALAMSKASGKPVFAFFQEVPG